MAQLKFLALLLATLVLVAACGGGATSGGVTSAPAATQAAQATGAAASVAAPATTGAATPAAATAAAPTAAPEATAAPAAELQVDRSKLAKELHVYDWADYVDPTVLEDFETEYGVKVTVDVYDNNEDMIAKIRAGNSGYDVVGPSDYAIDIMAKENLLARLDKSLLPNLRYMKPESLDLYYDKGNVYSVPYNLGLTGIAYNKKTFPTPPESWAVLFDPAQAEKYRNQFSMLDDAREVPGAALKYLGKSLNDTNPDDLKQVEAILKAQKPFLAAYDTSNFSRKLASGEYVLAHAYSSNALQARLGIEGDFSGNPDIGFVVPKEGGTIWQDNLAIVADSPNSYTAHVFLNYLMQPEIAARNTKFNLGVTPNAEAEKLLDPQIQEIYREGFAPTPEMLNRLEWIERNDRTAVFDELWTTVKGE